MFLTAFSVTIMNGSSLENIFPHNKFLNCISISQLGTGTEFKVGSWATESCILAK